MNGKAPRRAGQSGRSSRVHTSDGDGRPTIIPLSSDRSPPYSIEAEEGVLGAIFLDGEGIVLPQLVPILRAEDFYRDDHGIIYRSVLRLHREGKPTDIISVSDDLKRNEELEKAGDFEALQAL